MNLIKIKLITLVALIAILGSCSESEQIPEGEYARGVVVINEGNFSDANGTISFYNETNQEVAQDIFDEANSFSPGGLLQSIYFHENRGYIIDNLGSKIYIVEATTFELIHMIEDGLSSPRYMTVHDGKAYITNWGPFDENFSLNESYVSVIDLETFEQVSSIDTDSGSEGLMAFGGKICVANSFSNTIEIIDPAINQVVGQITVEGGPLSFVEDKDGTIWSLSSSFFGPSYLSTLNLNTEEVIKSIAIATSAKALTINSAGDELYYLSAPFGEDAGVFTQSISASEGSGEPIISGSNLYGLGIHPETGEIYVANHNAFQGNGTIIIYEGSTQRSSFAAGVGPNDFSFR